MSEGKIKLETTCYIKELDKWNPKKTIKWQLKEWKNFCMLINGMSRAGKSYMLKDILKPVIKKFDIVCVFSKTVRNGFYQEWLDTKLLFDSFRPDVIQILKEEYYIKKEQKKSFKTLVIIDDCISNNIKYSEAIGELFMSGRHFQCSTAILGQKCSSFSQAWFANCTIFISLFCGSRKEKKYIAENLIANVIEPDPGLLPKDRPLKFAEEEKEAYDIQTEICNDFCALIILPMDEEKKIYWYRAK